MSMLPRADFCAPFMLAWSTAAQIFLRWSITPDGVEGQLSWSLPQRGSVGAVLQNPISSVLEGITGKSMPFCQVWNGSPKVTKAMTWLAASPMLPKLLRAHSAP